MIREPVVAGKFYQSEPARLLDQVNSCFRHRHGVGKTPVTIDGKLLALISPHAGFIYSGPVASFAFARLAAETVSPDVILMLGPKHTSYGSPFSVSSHTAWKTPLGEMAVDQQLSRNLVDGVDLLKLDEGAHRLEHSLEVQLPFLQTSMKKLPTIVAVALQYSSFANIARIGEGIAEALSHEKRRIVMLVSSDFSHDTPKEEAYRLDSQALELILKLDAKGFYDLVVDEDRSICGLMPITALLVILQNLKVQAKLLKYATSMDMCEHDRGVGYAAVSFEALP